MRHASARNSPDDCRKRVDLYEASLEMARLAQAADEGPAGRLPSCSLCGSQSRSGCRCGGARRPLLSEVSTAIVSVHAVAHNCCGSTNVQRSRTDVERRHCPQHVGPAKARREHPPGVARHNDIAFVIGASPLERFWVEGMRQAFQPFAARVTFEWFNELSQEEMVKRAAMLPPRSALFYASVRVDAAGIPNEQNRLLARLRETANAPIFSYLDSQFRPRHCRRSRDLHARAGAQRRGGRRPHPER